MDAEGLRAFRETARRFAQRQVVKMVGGEGRDGDLGKLPQLLEKAESVGLLAAHDPSRPGHEFGVWGKASLSEGPAFSLVLLEEIAKACAGVAACLHFAGLGVTECMGWKDAPERTAVAFFEENWRPTRQALDRPPQSTARLRKDNHGHRLSGSKAFVQAPPGCEGFVVYAQEEGIWRSVFVPRGAKGFTSTNPGERTGLAALEVLHLSFEDTQIDPEHLQTPSDPSPFLRRLLLGTCAIAVGNASGALEAARNYAAERYQGGGRIESHPGVLLLLGDAATKISACSAHLQSVAAEDQENAASLWRAFAAKLHISTDCFQAVTHCLQVLGGYGYMEDFRLEKRLRDAMTLKALGIKPDDLRMFCALT